MERDSRARHGIRENPGASLGTRSALRQGDVESGAGVGGRGEPDFSAENAGAEELDGVSAQAAAFPFGGEGATEYLELNISRHELVIVHPEIKLAAAGGDADGDRLIERIKRGGFEGVLEHVAEYAIEDAAIDENGAIDGLGVDDEGFARGARMIGVERNDVMERGKRGTGLDLRSEFQAFGKLEIALSFDFVDDGAGKSRDGVGDCRGFLGSDERQQPAIFTQRAGGVQEVVEEDTFKLVAP